MKLHEWRQSSDLSKQQAADLFGVTRQAILNWENMTRFPEPAAMAKIRSATDGRVTADDFLDHWLEINNEVLGNSKARSTEG